MNKNPNNDLFISVDIETDGPYPLKNNLLAIGAVAFTPKGVSDQRFEVNLATLPTAVSNPDTMEWWSSQPEAWIYIRSNLKPVEEGILLFTEWVESISRKYKAKPIFAGYPAGFDFTWIYTYCGMFTGKSPFSFQAWDAKTYASCILKLAYKDTVKSKFPQYWLDKTKKHSHKPLDDALEQAIIMVNMLKENLAK